MKHSLEAVDPEDLSTNSVGNTRTGSSSVIHHTAIHRRDNDAASIMKPIWGEMGGKNVGRRT